MGYLLAKLKLRHLRVVVSGKYEEGLDDVGPLLLEHYTKKYPFDGTRKKWNDDGKLILEEKYINGELHVSKKE